MSELRRWLMIFCLCLSGATIYLLPYSTESFYKPLKKSLDLSNTEIGLLLSVLGAFNMIGYFPGGWLADRVSCRKLISFSLVGTGVIGLYFSTFPSYAMCFVVYIGWSITSIWTFWAAMIKATRELGGDGEQGRAFGVLEGGRGVIKLGISLIGVALLAQLVQHGFSQKYGFAAVVIFFSCLSIALGIFTLWALKGLPDENHEKDSSQTESRPQRSIGEAIEENAKIVFAVLKLPAIWLIGAIIFSAYTMYLGVNYFTPYATDVFALSVVMAGVLSSGKMIVRPIGAIGAGFLGDKVGSSKIICYAFVVSLVSFFLFTITPSYSSTLKRSDILDAEQLTAKLQKSQNPVIRHLYSSLPEELRQSLRQNTEPLSSSSPVVITLVNEINKILGRKDFYDEERFAGADHRALTTQLLTLQTKEENAQDRQKWITVNRLLLEDAFADEIAKLPEELAKNGPPSYMWLFLVANVFLAALCLYVLRGLYYALLEEGKVPVELTGTATGVVSVLGYTPDIFIPPLVGYLLDLYPGGVGYRYIYAIVGAICLIGLTASIIFIRKYRK